MKHIAVFASGTGSNTQKIIDHFRNHPSIKVALIVSNNKDAGVLEIAKKENIPVMLLEKEKFFHDAYVEELKEQSTDLIVLAGFLWKVPSKLIAAFPDQIINLHPALLPKFGGKGMFGMRVHQTVLDSKEKVSGISIHYVDDNYDNGKIIFQATCDIDNRETAETLAEKIHRLEHANYPKVIEDVINRQGNRPKK